MCGRYRLLRRKQPLSEHFDAVPFEDDWIPRYNIAPTQPVPVIRQTPNFRELALMRWGLISSWATDPSIGFKTTNARSETITTTASFRDPIRTQRCLIPADGFYEWSRNGRSKHRIKQPFCFEVGDGEMFAFATGAGCATAGSVIRVESARGRKASSDASLTGTQKSFVVRACYVPATLTNLAVVVQYSHGFEVTS